MEPNTETHLFELNLDQEVTSYLEQTARWAKFLGIVGFVFCGIIALAAFFMGAVYTSAFERMGASPGIGGTGSAAITIVYLAMAVVYFFPCLYLFRFGAKMQVALRMNDQPHLSQSFKNLKSCFKFVGILTIIAVGFSVLGLIIGVIAGAAFH